MIDETVTNPSVCLVTPADSSHKPKGMPNAKLGIAADMPKKIKLNCVFFNFSNRLIFFRHFFSIYPNSGSMFMLAVLSMAVFPVPTGSKSLRPSVSFFVFQK